MWGSRIASLTVHAVLIGAAVHFSGRTVTVGEVIGPAGIIPLQPDPAPRPRPAPSGTSRPADPAPTVPFDPSLVPTSIPPVSADPPGMPGLPGDSGFTGIDSLGPGPITPLLSTATIDARAADEPPQLISHPPLRYPEAMRRAGIEGRVLVEAVVDTAGLVERGSLRIRQSDGPLFESEAQAVVQASRYSSARHGGRAVRVRILVPVVFSLR